MILFYFTIISNTLNKIKFTNCACFHLNSLSASTEQWNKILFTYLFRRSFVVTLVVFRFVSFFFIKPLSICYFLFRSVQLGQFLFLHYFSSSSFACSPQFHKLLTVWILIGVYNVVRNDVWKRKMVSTHKKIKQLEERTKE